MASKKDVELLKNNLKKCDEKQLVIRDKNSNKLFIATNKKIKDLESSVAYLKKQIGNKTTPKPVKIILRKLRDTFSNKLKDLNKEIKKLNLYNRCVKGELKSRRVAMKKRKIVEKTTTTKSYEEELQFLN
jgi:hypothetical protein